MNTIPNDKLWQLKSRKTVTDRCTRNRTGRWGIWGLTHRGVLFTKDRRRKEWNINISFTALIMRSVINPMEFSLSQYTVWILWRLKSLRKCQNFCYSCNAIYLDFQPALCILHLLDAHCNLNFCPCYEGLCGERGRGAGGGVSKHEGLTIEAACRYQDFQASV